MRNQYVSIEASYELTLLIRYNAGHLIEAALAHSNYYKNDLLTEVIHKYVKVNALLIGIYMHALLIYLPAHSLGFWSRRRPETWLPRPPRD